MVYFSSLSQVVICLVCSLGAGPQSLLNVERRDTICWRAPEVSRLLFINRNGASLVLMRCVVLEIQIFMIPALQKFSFS